MKKGFTLIELLAVIVILAIISLIAIPIVLDIIEDSRRSAAIASAEGYVRAVNYRIAQEALNDNIISDGDYVIGNTSFTVSGNNFDSIGGVYTISDGSVLWGGFCISNLSIEYNSTTNFTGISKDVDYCDYEEPFVFVEPDGVLLSEVYADETKYSNTNFKIKTIEDLVAFSELVVSGKDFSSKTVYLVSDLDITSDDSYTNPNNTTYGDINGDSTTSGLKVELTTGAGFKPIGTDSKPFNGTFIGYAFMVDHLMINRPSTNNVGLFGYISTGTLTGIRIRNANVTGCGSTGALAGFSTGNIKNADVQATVSSTCNYVGGVVGSTWGGGFRLTETAFKGTVSGGNNVAGLLGANINNSQNIYGIVYDTTITATGSSIGRVSTYNGPAVVRVYNTTAGGASDGTEIYSLTVLSIDGPLDTIIGGDTDEDGYYFDVDDEVDGIVLYSGDVIPTRPPKGAGTEENPYIIKTIKDWNRATTTLDDTPHYYSLAGDLDFTDKKFNPFGSEDSPFNGAFNGNNHTISNVSLRGYKNTGVFGYVTGTVKSVNFNNITATGTNSNTGIIGYSSGILNGIKVRNATITGTGAVGGLVGYATGTVRSVDVQATVTGTGNAVGGVVGSTNVSLSIQYALFKGTVAGANYVSGILGQNVNNTGNIKSVVYDTTIIGTGGSTGKITTANNPSDYNRNYNTTITGSGIDGTEITSMTIGNVDGMLDTIIGGDVDGDHYYFDYNASGGIELYSTDIRPFGQLQGDGTQNNPYIIDSTAAWKKAVATIAGSTPYYYSITSNLDFTDQLFYPMGTYYSKFNGTINGNNHTISNVTLNGYSYTGLFGYNTGTITGINFDTIAITSEAARAGLIGTNTGMVNGVKIRNLTITGTSTIGGITGYLDNGGNIKNVDVQGTIIGTGTTVGGIIGYANGSSSLTDAVFKGTLSGTKYIAGLAGEKFNGTISGFVYDTSITATTSDAAYFTTRNSPNNCKGYKIPTSPAVSVTLISSKTLEAVDGTIDTTIGGDSGNDGYYFTLTNGEYELITAE